MRFSYKPEGADPREWDFDASKLLSPEAEAIERNTGMTYQEWQDSLRRGSMLAFHGLLYVMLKRSNPTLKWDQVVFSYGEVDFILDEEETRQTIAALEAQDSLTDSEEEALRELRASLDAAPKDPPKGPSKNAGSSTSGSSPTTSTSDPGNSTS